ncbi:MAG: hypothetical protein ACXVCY_18235, partial [Pseudobdellovibrionaceae bacterium]
QKRFDIGLAWSKHNQADVIMDLPYLLSQERNFLSKEAYEEVMRRFLNIGNNYCTKRNDYYGQGEEFLALGDLLLETLLKRPH